MNKNGCKIILRTFFLCGVLFWVFGCASSQMWYKSGHNQVDFDVDNQECRRIAEELGRQATITGEKINLDVFNTSYNNCLFSRGWTHTPPGAEQKNVLAVELAKLNGNRIIVFDKQLTLPLGFNLIRNQISGFQDVRMQTLFFQGDGPVFFNMIIQESLSRQFDLIDYPANEPFFVFEKGKNSKDKLRVSWTVFSGDFKGDWVAGIGAYYLVNKTQRISFVMTKAIPSPRESPPAGLRLTESQKIAVENFSDQWLGKIKVAFDASEKALNIVLE